MSRWIHLGPGGLIGRWQIVAVGRAKSAPVRRLLEAAGPGKVLNMTYGYPRQSVVLLDNGFLAVVSLTVEELLEHLDLPDGGEL